jgi:hypothetical protein
VRLASGVDILLQGITKYNNAGRIGNVMAIITVQLPKVIIIAQENACRKIMLCIGQYVLGGGSILKLYSTSRLEHNGY